MSPAELFSALREHAKAMRADGVTSLQIAPDGSCAINFAPYTEAERIADMPAGAAVPQARHQPQPLNAMDDPDTFGGSLPGWDLAGVPANPVSDQ